MRRALRAVVGALHVLQDDARVGQYTTGYRHGSGRAAAVALPGSLVELWQCAVCCARHGAIIIVQAANTGLTGGSTPDGAYDRPVVVISTERLGGVHPIANGEEAICLAGSTLTELETAISRFGRAPHSVIGSSCIGASVVGGICNNSGGALVERGPAFTDEALFARIRMDGSLELINRLGIALDGEPESVLRAVEAGTFPEIPRRQKPVSHYEHHVRQVEEPSPARYNADPRGLHDASGSAGKVIVFAVRVPTFPLPNKERTFIVATDRGDALADLRRALLDPGVPLPKQCEYLHRDATSLALAYGNDVTVLLQLFGAGAMPKVLRLQRRLASAIGKHATDRLAHLLSRVAPHPLPRRLRGLFASYEHVLLLTAADEAIGPVRALLEAHSPNLVMTELDPSEAAAAMRVRFAVAGAGVRCRDLLADGGDLAALDIALPRNRRDFRLELPPALAAQVKLRADYGHFLCHVFHCDFLLKPGVERCAFEADVKTLVEALGGQMPAEHNFGHLYKAPPHVVDFYRQLDPTNSLNPGIGGTSRTRNWA